MPSSNDSSPQKRHDGADLKISFTHSKLNLDVPHSDLESTAAALTRFWYKYAVKGSGQLFGAILKSEHESFYYRTIIEGDGFGEQYEDVNACGHLSGILPIQGGPPSPF